MVDTISKKYEPQIILTIPKNLTADFLGIMALDVLHDSKGHGYLAGHRLSQLTDLLSESIFIHNDQLDNTKEAIQNYTFMQVLTYFLQLWSNNIKALGFMTPPDATTDINELRKTAMLPLHNVADRSDDDAFTSLGAGKHGIEAQNYYDQRDKLTRRDAETMAFISPAGIKRPADYFRQASGIVDIIQERTAEKSQVVLDMKSAAGLIRTLTDPLGYTTGIPTYADPGYNMPGMSAIRQHAKVEFVNADPNQQKYAGVSEFRYVVKLNVDWSDYPITFLDVTYFYGVGESGLDRKNVMINILNDPFGGSLPRSLTMAESLNQYLTVAERPVSVSVEETLSIVERLIWNYYQGITIDNPLINSLNKIWIKLHIEKPSIDDFVGVMGQFSDAAATAAASAFAWCNVENTTLRVSYILSTLRNCEYFQIYPELQKLRVNSICPKEMISKILPELLYSYITELPSTRLLAFCDNQIKLLQQFIGQQDKTTVPYQQDLHHLLSTQWLPKHKGKLITQIANQTKMWRKNQALKLQDSISSINEYIATLVNFCKENIGTISELDYIDDCNPQITEFLAQLPAFKPSIVLEKVLDDHLQFYQPEMYSCTRDITKTGLLLAVILDVILGKNPLIKIDTNLSDQLEGFANSELSDHIHETLKTVIGKFSGDFGQIMWCICYGHLFASEDNNTSAMALLLHRLPKNCIIRNLQENCGAIWGNIHGLGDGSCVDVTIDK